MRSQFWDSREKETLKYSLWRFLFQVFQFAPDSSFVQRIQALLKELDSLRKKDEKGKLAKIILLLF